jgi:hypothetical protein
MVVLQFGLTGVVTLGMTELTLSDFHPAVLNTLDLNIKLNLGPSPPTLLEVNIYYCTCFNQLYKIEKN